MLNRSTGSVIKNNDSGPYRCPMKHSVAVGAWRAPGREGVGCKKFKRHFLLRHDKQNIHAVVDLGAAS